MAVSLHSAIDTLVAPISRLTAAFIMSFGGLCYAPTLRLAVAIYRFADSGDCGVGLYRLHSVFDTDDFTWQITEPQIVYRKHFDIGGILILSLYMIYFIKKEVNPF